MRARIEGDLAIMAPTSSVIILWVYIVLLLAGGLMGFLKAGSKISLITAAAFALLLALCAITAADKSIQPFWWMPLFPAEIVIGGLVVLFGVRYAKGKKFMPSGLMLSLSVIVLAALLLLR
jgi:uncharacterized membrane protein (UPF0136 family)